MRKTDLLSAAILAFLLSLSACGVSQYTANTTASVSPGNGFAYSSNKNQENLDATGDMNPDGTVHFTVKTTATTPDAAIAAALQSNLEAQKQLTAILQAIMPLIATAAKVGAKVP